jgi:TonB-like protein
MVYPVEKALTLPRKSQLVVSTGPMGGGGLNVYGALHCGKIYTIFLEMPGKNWTMQFCQHGEKNENSVKQTQSAVVHLEEGLVAPYAESKFDFRRLPVPEKDSRKLIVLKGILQEDGTVGKLEVYQGLLSEMDEAAKLALGRWKFKPATRAKIPVAVDILVGVPAQVPRSH